MSITLEAMLTPDMAVSGFNPSSIISSTIQIPHGIIGAEKVEQFYVVRPALSIPSPRSRRELLKEAGP